MNTEIPYSLLNEGSGGTAWAMDVYQRIRMRIDVLDAQHSAGGWSFDVRAHGLNPVTFQDWWVFVAYPEGVVGMLLRQCDVDVLRSSFSDSDIVVCGNLLSDMTWVQFAWSDDRAEQIHHLLGVAMDHLVMHTRVDDRSTVPDLRELKAKSPNPSSQSLVLLWNPDAWEWRTFDVDVAHVKAGGRFVTSWKVRYPYRVFVGMRFYLLRTGSEPRGIMGSGSVISPPYTTAHFSEGSESQYSVDIVFNRLLDPGSDELLNRDVIIGTEALSKRFAAIIQSSGTVLTPEESEALCTIWQRHCGDDFNDEGTEDMDSAEWSDRPEYYCYEGEVRQFSTDRHERSGAARTAAIRIHGASCSICNIDFETVYGEIGRGFIHVHHLDPVSNSESRRRVDPARDLVPVCPNCHAMLHRRKDVPFTPEELKERMQPFQR
jgi:5-methylcytosine-specific restriction protein A